MTTITMTNELFATWENLTEANFFETPVSSIQSLIHCTSAREITDIITQHTHETHHLFQAQMGGHPIFVRVDCTKEIWLGENVDNLEFYGEL